MCLRDANLVQKVSVVVWRCCLKVTQDKIFRRKRLSIGANFVHVYIEIWDKGILKLINFQCNNNETNNVII